MKPKYFVRLSTIMGNITVDMLYAVYEKECFFATNDIEGNPRWEHSFLGLAFFNRSSHYSPCSLKDVRAQFNNIKAHKYLTNI
mgnify:CR=1 FL=1